MEPVDTAEKILRGGEFIVSETDPSSVFIQEDFTEEQNMVLAMVDDFVQKRVLPVADQIEKLDIELTKKLMKEAGDLG